MTTETIGTEVVSVAELSESRLLMDTDLLAVAEALRNCPIHTLKKDDVLISPGSSNEALYIVLQGQLTAHINSLDDNPLWSYGRGDSLGELSLISGRAAFAYVRATEASRVLVIDQNIFWSLVNSEPALARNMLCAVADRSQAGFMMLLQGRLVVSKDPRGSAIDDIHSRGAFEDLLRRNALRCAMNGGSLSLLFVAIDNLSELTEKFGVRAREYTIGNVANLIRGLVRPTDTVGRMDDERFAIMLDNADEDVARIVAKRLSAEAGDLVVSMPDQSILPPPSVSIGLAESIAFERIEALLQRAGEALIRARGKGPGGFSY